MKCHWLVAVPIMLCTLAVAQSKSAKSTFTMKCQPFKSIEVKHPIDGSCGISGKGADGTALQNQTKNNFCAGDNYQTITQQDLASKQQQVAALPGYLKWSGEDMPTSRGDLVKLGEGTAVQFVGYIFEAHYADVTSGESVNCETKGDAYNDIHIALVPQTGVTDECQSNTAEMSPHYRPASWTPENLEKIGKTMMVRVSGQLMYDADHKICGEQGFSAKDNPSRMSGWEIHPVYAFDVCVQQSGGQCSQWQALSDWAGTAAKSSTTKKRGTKKEQ